MKQALFGARRHPEPKRERRTMSPDPSPSHWTAALLGADDINLWTMSASQAQQRHQFSRSTATPEQDLVAALDHIQAPKANPVLVSGLLRAPLVNVPAKPGALTMAAEVMEGWQLQLLPDLMQSSPQGLLQGHTVQIAGFLALNPKWDGVICLPGAVTHWVQVSAAEVVSFQSTLTTGLQATLATALTLGSEMTPQSSWAESALREAADDTMSRPERLASRLAELQAQIRHANPDGAEIMGKLWGYLIGAELAAARPYWLGQNLALIAEEDLAAPYLAALRAQGLPVTQTAPERMALAGLVQAWRHAQGDAQTSN